MRIRFVIGAILLVLCGGVQARTLSWDALDVTAQLDREGRLHIVERHTMIFNGDWNGGERHFRIDRGQRFEFIGLYAIEPITHARRALRPGRLEHIGEFKFFGDDVLRWRARLPTDPPFANTKRVYEIEYELAGIVTQNGNEYLLDHDFAFPDRPGPIEHFSLRFDLDPTWQAADGLSYTVQRENLLPGSGVVLRLPLSFVGSKPPRALAPKIDNSWQGVPARIVNAILMPNPEPWRTGLLVVVALFAIARGVVWYRHEKSAGRFEALTPLDRIDRAWLQKNVFVYAPEIVGAAWDLDTSANEVAAVLARMTQEGKLKSSVATVGKSFWRRDVLQLTLACERASLQGYERNLIDALFVDGANSTDTEKVREHYASKGFNPALLIQPALAARLKDLVSINLPIPSVAKWVTAALLVTGSSMLAIGFIRDTDNWRGIVFIAVPLFAMLLLGSLSAANYRKSVDNLFKSSRGVLQFVLVALVILAFALFGILFRWSEWQPVAFALTTAGIVNSIFNAMWCRETLVSLRFRQALASARRYFQTQLQSSSPQLDDAWYPYLLAFGLGKNVDRWFKSSGRAVDNSAGSYFGANASSSTASSPSWTGGGGAFGGGGASGSWAAAVSGIAASISAPSSSSSSGGGSSGGSSSGGGGGGGW